MENAREKERKEKRKKRERESRREDGEEQRRWSRNVAHARPRPRELLTIHFCDFLLPFPTLTAVSSPALPPPPPALSSSPCLIPFCSPREFEIADCCWRRVQTREEDCSCAREKKRKRERSRRGGGEGREKDREKAEANGVTWPKDAKLPKRSTRKA